jgi:hypothetical protein
LAQWLLKFVTGGLMVFDPFHEYISPDFTFRIARAGHELDGYWRLRRQIFCEEQAIFSESDRDEFDQQAIPIVCETLIAGMEDGVVGVVRIDERAPGVWYGSRLGVDLDYRSIRQFSPSVSVRNSLPVYRGLGALGAGLIYKAVSTAHALGPMLWVAPSFLRQFNTRTHVSFNGYTGSHSVRWICSVSPT